jgi:transcriptional regulator with XRE-family HTH domain
MWLSEISLKAARVNAELTLEDVSRETGVSVPTLSKWENYKTFPTARQLKTLCRLYSQSMDDIIVPDSLTEG